MNLTTGCVLATSVLLPLPGDREDHDSASADAAGRWQERAAVTGPKNPGQPVRSPPLAASRPGAAGRSVGLGVFLVPARGAGGEVFGGRGSTPTPVWLQRKAQPPERTGRIPRWSSRAARSAPRRSQVGAERPRHQVAHEMLAGWPEGAGPGYRRGHVLDPLVADGLDGVPVDLDQQSSSTPGGWCGDS